MKKSRKVSTSTLTGLHNFSQWLKKHRNGDYLWTIELRNWFQTNVGFSSDRKLSQETLANYLYDVTQDEALKVGGINQFGCLNQIKQIERWTRIENLEKARTTSIDTNLAAALLNTKFLTIGNERITSLRTLLHVLEGKVDPFGNPNAIHIGTDLADRLAFFVSGVVFGSTGKDIMKHSVLEEFAFDQWRKPDIESGGRLYSLVRGYVAEVTAPDLARVANCIEQWRKKYEGSDSQFSQVDLEGFLFKRSDFCEESNPY